MDDAQFLITPRPGAQAFDIRKLGHAPFPLSGVAAWIRYLILAGKLA